MKFTDRLREKAAPIWEREMEHPFVSGIGDGSLPLDKFKYYLCQDYLFLIEYSRLFGLAVARSDDLETMGRFAELLSATLNVEMDLHRSYARKFGIEEEELEDTEMSPTTHAYTRHLLHVAETGTTAELVAAVLPCAWGYWEIGTRLAKKGEPKAQLLYEEWIKTYSSQEFGEFADWLKDLLDSLSNGLNEHELRKLEGHFITSSRYEYMFWEMSYNEEEWPV